MRRNVMTVAAALLAACGDTSGPVVTPVPEPEVPRGEYQLLVERFSPSGARAHYRMAPDGSSVSEFPGIPSDALFFAPSPDGRAIAYLRAQESDVHLWVMDREGTHHTPLLTGTRVVEYVAWSPDGLRLVYESSDFDSSSDIWVINADGSGAVDLTPDPKPGIIIDHSPSWSPDGRKIAFTSNRGGGNRIWLMQANGSNSVQLVPATVDAFEHSPVWSFNGAQIAFVSQGPGGSGIAVIGPDGSGYRVFPLAGHVGRPAWSPDGRVLYSTDSDGNYEIYALDPASGNATNLTHSRDHDYRAVPLRYVAPTAWKGFGSPVWYPVNRPDAAGIAAGDIVADRVPDLVVLSPSAEELRLLKGTGGGTLSLLGGITTGGGPSAVRVANITQTASADVAVLSPGSIQLWNGGAGGTGAPATHLLDGVSPDLVAADFDGDGYVDLMTTPDSGSGIRLRLYARAEEGRMIPILDAATPFTGAGRSCASDVTGEGTPDLVLLTSQTSAPIVIYPGYGGLDFALPITTGSGVTPDISAIPLCVDLDGDRRADLIRLLPGHGLFLHRSTGNAFANPVWLNVTGTDIVALDIDHDGDTDLLVAQPSENRILFLRNLGDGRFAAGVPIRAEGGPTHLVAADLNGDGWEDLAVTDGTGQVGVLINRGRN